MRRVVTISRSRPLSPTILLRTGLLSILLLALGDVSEAATLEVGQTLTSQRFEWTSTQSSRAAGTYGQYVVALQAGTTYEIKTSNPSGGTTQDTYLYLLNANFTIVAQDDDSNGGLQARIRYTPSTSGTFYVRLRAYARGRYGFCSLTLQGPNAPAPPPPPPPATVIAPGDTLNNQYFAWENTSANRVDGEYASYTITMTAGTQYTFVTANAHGGTTTDTYLYVLNPAGTIVAADDDSAGNLASRIVYRPSAGGTYTVKVRAYAKGKYGYCTLAVTSPTQGGGGNPRLPDLIVWNTYLRDASLQGSSSQKLLRFSNAVPNIGVGPLELYGVVQPDGTTYAYQRVWNDNSTFADHLAGSFVFDGHQGHNHWHFGDFADYNLRSVTPDGGVGAVVATSQKVSFCLVDVARYSSTAGPARYSCSNQGITVGWADVYSSSVSGQWINVTSVPDGTYWLESIVDPVNRLLETNNANNVTRLKIRIVKATNTVTVLE